MNNEDFYNHMSKIITEARDEPIQEETPVAFSIVDEDCEEFKKTIRDAFHKISEFHPNGNGDYSDGVVDAISFATNVLRPILRREGIL